MSGKVITVSEGRNSRLTAGRAALPLTVESLFERYTKEARYLPDGSPKTETYLEHVRQTGCYLAKFFGPYQPIDALTPDRIHEYVVWRRNGGVSDRIVGANTIQRDLGMFKAALNWACQKYQGGQPLLTRHVLEKVRVPTEKDPKRPLLDTDSIHALLVVAPTIHRFLRPMILLAWRTGRRLSSILSLRWDDVDFERGTILWRPEHDKIRQTWVVPVRWEVLYELLRFRNENRRLRGPSLFPHPQRREHHGGPVTRHLAAYWLKEAFCRGRIPKPAGGLWHMFRRVWATERKDLPLKDVAAAGGWRDTSTLLRYQQPDEETLRAVVEHERGGKDHALAMHRESAMERPGCFRRQTLRGCQEGRPITTTTYWVGAPFSVPPSVPHSLSLVKHLDRTSVHSASSTGQSPPIICRRLRVRLPEAEGSACE